MSWFSASRARPAPHSEPAPARADADELDEAIDTLRSVLLAFGEHSFDTDLYQREVTSAQFSDLARRLVVGPARDDGGVSGTRRDYREVRLSLRRHREHEAKYVDASVSNFRDALRACLGALARAVAEDREADRQIGARVGELVSAFHANDSDAIRREATLMAGLVQRAMERRRQRETAQLSELTASVKVLQDELRDARRKAGRDPVTDLFDREAFHEHVQRTAELAAFGVGTPFMVLIDLGQVEEPGTLRGASDLLVRTFLRSDDFVAHADAGHFAVIVVASALDRVLSRAERLRAALTQLAVPSAAVGLAGLIPGEEVGAWLSRAERAVSAARDERCQRVVVASD